MEKTSTPAPSTSRRGHRHPPTVATTDKIRKNIQNESSGSDSEDKEVQPVEEGVGKVRHFPSCEFMFDII